MKDRAITQYDTNFILNNHKDKTVRQLADELDLDEDSVREYMQFLGISEKKSKSVWTKEEIDTLRNMADKQPSLIAETLGRTEKAVKRKAKQEGIALTQTSRHWTDSELDFLKENWGAISLNNIASHIKRSPLTIQNKAYQLGLGSASSNSAEMTIQEFSELSGITETRLRTTLYKKYNFPLIKRRITLKVKRVLVDTEKAIKWMKNHQELWDAAKTSPYLFVDEPTWFKEKREKDRKYGANKHITKVDWTSSEDDLLKIYISDGFDVDEIAKRLNKSRNQIIYRISKIGYGYRLSRFWKGSDFGFLRRNYTTMTDKEIASKLGKSESSVRHHRLQMGLYKLDSKKESRRWTESELRYIENNLNKQSDAQLANNLNRTVGSIRYIRNRKGLKRDGQKD